MMRRSKKISQRVHARRRAAQRYGINFGQNRHDHLVKSIQNNHAYRPGGEVIIRRKITNRLTEFVVWSKLDKEWFPVVYDKHRKQIVTLLTMKSSNTPNYIPTESAS